jgi:hypothetical protein
MQAKRYSCKSEGSLPMMATVFLYKSNILHRVTISSARFDNFNYTKVVVCWLAIIFVMLLDQYGISFVCVYLQFYLLIHGGQDEYL